MIYPKQYGELEALGDQASGVLALSIRAEMLRVLSVNQSTVGQALLLPNPVDTSVVFGFDVVNIGTAGFQLEGSYVDPGFTARATWNGSAWSVLPDIRSYCRSFILGANFTFSTTTLTQIPDLQFNVLAGETWAFETALIGTYNGGSDARFQVDCAGATGIFSVASMEQATQRTANINASTINLPLATGQDSLRVAGSLTATAAATFSISVRNNSGTNAQQIDAGSWLKVARV